MSKFENAIILGILIQKNRKLIAAFSATHFAWWLSNVILEVYKISPEVSEQENIKSTCNSEKVFHHGCYSYSKGEQMNFVLLSKWYFILIFLFRMLRTTQNQLKTQRKLHINIVPSFPKSSCWLCFTYFWTTLVWFCI